MITFINQDLLSSSEKIIAHQCNCKTPKEKGLSKAMFEKYPYSNIYTLLNRTPGEIIVREEGEYPIIVALLGQNKPGSPSLKETKGIRLEWFKKCLNKLALYMKNKNLNQVGIPYNIGCGLAKGNWNDYYTLIKSFAENNNINVNLYYIII